MLVEHHIKYKEIHGIDETIWMTNSDHQKLHRHLRKEGRCNISVKELAKISHRAIDRTLKCKTRIKQYCKSREVFTFTESLLPNVQLREDIYYNPKLNIWVSSFFRGLNNKKLLVIDI